MLLAQERKNILGKRACLKENNQVLVSQLQQIVMKGPERRRRGGITVPDVFNHCMVTLNRLILYIAFYLLLFS